MKLELSGILKLTQLEIPPHIQEEANTASSEANLKLLPEEKRHVTLIHQSLTKGLKGIDLGNIQLPELSFDGAEVVFIEDGERQTIKIVLGLSDQEKLNLWVGRFRQEYLPAVELPSREYHVSWANFTGLPGDSVK